jgi:hypothetical protein
MDQGTMNRLLRDSDEGRSQAARQNYLGAQTFSGYGSPKTTNGAHT